MAFRNFLLISLTGGLISCFYSPNDGSRMVYSQLKIVIDSSANFYLDSFTVSAKDNYCASKYSKYDSSLGSFAYIFDSVENGNIDITLTSLLDRTFNKRINLQSDTTILVSKNELNNFQSIKEIPSLNLNASDTIVIGLESFGCFHFLKENVVISKGTDKYNVSFNTTRLRGHGYGNMNLKKEFDLSFNEQIKLFYNSCEDFLRQRKEDEKNGIGRFSTTSAFIYIRKSNFVFKFPDIGPYDWVGYDNLINAIDPPWPKQSN